VVLLVGKEEVRIPCHKALLGHFSKFFEATLYSGFSEATATEIPLPDEIAEHVQELVFWLYTGESQVERKLAEDPPKDLDATLPEAECQRELCALKLWVFADKLMCASFANYVIEQLIKFYKETTYSSWEADFVFGHTTRNSELRLLFKTLMAADGPLRKERLSNPVADACEYERWLSLLEKGGDLVRECATDGFTGYNEEKWELPRETLGKYMQKVPEISVEDWIKQRYPGSEGMAAQDTVMD
jgi:hypothetical protein